MFDKLNNFAFFLEHPTTHIGVREFARHARISPASASTYLERWRKDGLLQAKTDGVYRRYRADLESAGFRDLKVYWTITKLRQTIPKLNKVYQYPTIILFGSASKGLDTEASDIDLCIISESDQKISDDLFKRHLKRPVHLFVRRSIEEFHEHLAASILNGIVLQGEVQWTGSAASMRGGQKQQRPTAPSARAY